MNWWHLLFGAGGAGGFAAALGKALRSHRLRQIAVDVLDGPDTKTDAVGELRVLLEEQRKVLDTHIASAQYLDARVGALEATISTLERALIEERTKAKNLQRQLRDERKLSATRIAELERQLASAEDRIAHLEAQLDEARHDA